MTRQRPTSRTHRIAGIGQRPPFRWTCPACRQTVVTLITVSAAPTCSAHTGGGRAMEATRIRFRDLPNASTVGDRSETTGDDRPVEVDR